MMSVTPIYRDAGWIAMARAIKEKRVVARSLVDKSDRVVIFSNEMLAPALAHGDCITMVKIPAGRNKIQRTSNVQMDEFWISMTPVTIAHFKLFLKTTGQENAWQGYAEKYRHPDKYPPNWYDHLPIVDIPFKKALEFANWAGMRLPIEAEWEKSCRGTHGNKYAWGDSDEVLSGVAFKNYFIDALTQNFPGSRGPWLRIGSRDKGKDDLRIISGPAPVNRRWVENTASAFGVLDLSGNVWEWTSSINGSSEIEKLVPDNDDASRIEAAFNASADGLDIEGVQLRKVRPAGLSDDGLTNVIVRGGSWYEGRNWPQPPYMTLQGDFRRVIGIDSQLALRNNHYGIRLAANSV